MGAHFEALDEGVLLVPFDPRYTQVGFNLVSVQVCKRLPFPTNDVHFFGGEGVSAKRWPKVMVVGRSTNEMSSFQNGHDKFSQVLLQANCVTFGLFFAKKGAQIF